jgi:hypothetical protein
MQLKADRFRNSSGAQSIKLLKINNQIVTTKIVNLNLTPPLKLPLDNGQQTNITNL